MLADFCGASCALHGQDPAAADKWDYFKDWGIDEDQFWEPINAVGREFWATLPKLPWADDLIAMVEEIDPDFHICTKPSLRPDCMAGKLDWLQRQFGTRFRRYIFAPNKTPLAAPGRILIDDSDDNNRSWLLAGGQVVVCPQPWNVAAAEVDRRIESIREQLFMHTLVEN